MPKHLACIENGRGLSLLRRSDTAGALSSFERAHRLCPAAAPITANLVSAYLDVGMVAKARECLRSAGAAHSDEPSLIHALGMLALREGRHGDADACFEKARQMAAGDARRNERSAPVGPAPRSGME